MTLWTADLQATAEGSSGDTFVLQLTDGARVFTEWTIRAAFAHAHFYQLLQVQMKSHLV